MYFPKCFCSPDTVVGKQRVYMIKYLGDSELNSAKYIPLLQDFSSFIANLLI